MSLGIVCHIVEERTRNNGEVYQFNLLEERILQLGRYRDGKYTHQHIIETYENNARGLARAAELIRRGGYGCYRITSALFPLMDLVGPAYYDTPTVRHLLQYAGDLFRSSGVRVGMHPGQFCVLSSDDPRVVGNAIVELQNHAWVLDTMGMPQDHSTTINIHGGKADRLDNLVSQIAALPDNVKNRLTLENDESGYSTLDLLHVTAAVGTPIVFDSHHHTFNDGGLSLDEAFCAAVDTWPDGIKPLQHVSNTQPGLESGSFSDRRKHSDRIHTIPEPQLSAVLADQIDLECECKLKNIAVDELRTRYNTRLHSQRSVHLSS